MGERAPETTPAGPTKQRRHATARRASLSGEPSSPMVADGRVLAAPTVQELQCVRERPGGYLNLVTRRRNGETVLDEEPLPKMPEDLDALFKEAGAAH